MAKILNFICDATKLKENQIMKNNYEEAMIIIGILRTVQADLEFVSSYFDEMKAMSAKSASDITG